MQRRSPLSLRHSLRCESVRSGVLADLSVLLPCARSIGRNEESVRRATVYCEIADAGDGRLRLDAREYVFDQPVPVVVAGDPGGSELLRRVLLPEDHEDAMPPKGERLSSTQTQLLERWIVEGAEWPEGS